MSNGTYRIEDLVSEAFDIVREEGSSRDAEDELTAWAEREAEREAQEVEQQYIEYLKRINFLEPQTGPRGH